MKLKDFIGFATAKQLITVYESDRNTIHNVNSRKIVYDSKECLDIYEDIINSPLGENDVVSMSAENDVFVVNTVK